MYYNNITLIQTMHIHNMIMKVVKKWNVHLKMNERCEVFVLNIFSWHQIKIDTFLAWNFWWIIHMSIVYQHWIMLSSWYLKMSSNILYWCHLYQLIIVLGNMKSHKLTKPLGVNKLSKMFNNDSNTQFQCVILLRRSWSWFRDTFVVAPAATPATTTALWSTSRFGITSPGTTPWTGSGPWPRSVKIKSMFSLHNFLVLHKAVK